MHQTTGASCHSATTPSLDGYRAQERLELIREPRRRDDQVPCAGGSRSSGGQADCHCVAHALDRRVVIAGGDQRGDAGMTEQFEWLARLAGRSAPLRPTNTTRDLLG